MGDLINALLGAQPWQLLMLAGFVFLLVAVVVNISVRIAAAWGIGPTLLIATDRNGRIAALGIGAALLVAGGVMSQIHWPVPTPSLTPTAGSTSLPVGAGPNLPATSTVGVATVKACEFQYGFQKLHDIAPDIVGDCYENEEYGFSSGEPDVTADALQRTSNGTLYWLKYNHTVDFTSSPNLVFFVDTLMTKTRILILCSGNNHLAVRPYGERFPAEPNSQGLPLATGDPCG